MIVLDTHAWVWWVAGDRRLSATARRELERGMGSASLYVSSISSWEVALLVRRGRLELTMQVDDWVARSEALPFLTFVPVDNRITLRSVGLERVHDDPADRIIVATALSLGARLVTRDRRLRSHPGVETVW
jgi:PIN domain nuclease of toxin-antitoxin system